MYCLINEFSISYLTVEKISEKSGLSCKKIIKELLSNVGKNVNITHLPSDLILSSLLENKTNTKEEVKKVNTAAKLTVTVDEAVLDDKKIAESTTLKVSEEKKSEPNVEIKPDHDTEHDKQDAKIVDNRRETCVQNDNTNQFFTNVDVHEFPYTTFKYVSSFYDDSNECNFIKVSPSYLNGKLHRFETNIDQTEHSIEIKKALTERKIYNIAEKPSEQQSFLSENIVCYGLNEEKTMKIMLCEVMENTDLTLCFSDTDIDIYGSEVLPDTTQNYSQCDLQLTKVFWEKSSQNRKLRLVNKLKRNLQLEKRLIAFKKISNNLDVEKANLFSPDCVQKLLLPYYKNIPSRFAWQLIIVTNIYLARDLIIILLEHNDIYFKFRNLLNIPDTCVKNKKMEKLIKDQKTNKNKLKSFLGFSVLSAKNTLDSALTTNVSKATNAENIKTQPSKARSKFFGTSTSKVNQS